MPELPDVQVFRERLDEHALGRRVTTVGLHPDGMTVDTSASALRDAFRGHPLEESRRHGKQLFIRSGEERGRWLRLHFGMTGSLHVCDEGEKELDHTRLRFGFEDGGSLVFRCPRKLGQIGLVEDPDAWIREKGLGPDPLSEGFDLRDVRRVLKGRTGSIKATLMNQAIISGIGNIYADEALFQAGIHPGTPTNELEDDRVGELWRSARRVLEKAVEYRVDVERMPVSWLLPHREDGTACPRCGGTIRKAKFSGRSSCFCDRHQER
jgi:formamidopyrimidine-DNA glycosylase